ncbi:SpoIIE family protein phosphatase [Streptomyces erythrochromogenes]|uniref:SpoIIE family protein phosphatase n=1 Tax=Streptomyces sp. gCLA4 TaxID=1873416 RepID=UPI0016030248|nr:SpoIIE family protein phosphatase [Streptomyces sp. gCLA4]MBZ9599235.1 SpoIIE family protein phosphatase [Streptomyces erythrochromogenes]
MPAAYLRGTPRLPLGLGFHTYAPPEPNRARLQPGDRVLLYGEGVTEARSPEGVLFGAQCRGDAVIRSPAAAGQRPRGPARHPLLSPAVRHGRAHGTPRAAPRERCPPRSGGQLPPSAPRSCA